jgi:hypothetical protein
MFNFLVITVFSFFFLFSREFAAKKGDVEKMLFDLVLKVDMKPRAPRVK